MQIDSVRYHLNAITVEPVFLGKAACTEFAHGVDAIGKAREHQAIECAAPRRDHVWVVTAVFGEDHLRVNS